MPQVQFQSVKQKQIPVQRVQRKIEISQLQLVQEAMRSAIRRMTLEKTFKERDTPNQAVVRIVNEAARACRIECLRNEIRESIPPASIKQAMEMQAVTEHSKREEILQSEGDQRSEINLARGERFSNNTSWDVCVVLVTSTYFNGIGNDSSFSTYSLTLGTT